MRSPLLPALLLLVSGPSLGATGSVVFSGGGYCIEVVVGLDQRPEVAHLLFAPPGGTRWIHLPKEHLVVEVFDPRRQILRIRYRNPAPEAQPPAFVLEVQKGVGLLRIGRKRVRGTFDWTQ